MNLEPLFLISALTEALSHKVRTPLSVVMNDLSYFKSLLPGEDVDRSIARLEEISNILSVVTVPLPDLRFDRAVIKAHLEKLVSDRGAKWANFPVTDGEAFFVAALAEVRRSVEFLLTSREGELDSAVSEDDECVTLVMSGPTSPRLHEPGTYSSLTECLVRGLEQETLVAPLVDAIIRYHTGSIEIELGAERVVATLSFIALAPYEPRTPPRR